MMKIHKPLYGLFLILLLAAAGCRHNQSKIEIQKEEGSNLEVGVGSSEGDDGGVGESSGPEVTSLTAPVFSIAPTTVDVALSGEKAVFTVDKQFHVHALYPVDDSRLRYAFLEGGRWNTEQVYGGSYLSNSLSIIADSHGVPHLFFYYKDLQENKDKLVHAKKVDGVWTPEIIATANHGGPTYAAVDSRDNVYLIYSIDTAIAIWTDGPVLANLMDENVDSGATQYKPGILKIIEEEGNVTGIHFYYYIFFNDNPRTNRIEKWVYLPTERLGTHTPLRDNFNEYFHLSLAVNPADLTPYTIFMNFDDVLVMSLAAPARPPYTELDIGHEQNIEGLEAVFWDSNGKLHLAYYAEDLGNKLIYGISGSGEAAITVDSSATGLYPISMLVDDQGRTHILYYTSDKTLKHFVKQ